MAYSTGSTILDDDYNIFATGNAGGTENVAVANVNTIWGPGDIAKGYGQGSLVAAVAAPAVITATQWTTLLNRMTTIANHQGTTLTAITNPIAGDTIAAHADLSTNLTAIWNNRLDAAASGTDTSTATTSTTTWDVQATTTKTFTFASADQARYFFNCGGMLRLSWSLTGTSGDAKSLEWANLLSQCGTIVFTGGTGTATIAGVNYTGTTKVGGSGTTTTLTANTGYYDLTPGGAAVTIFKQFADTSPYTTNYVSITAALSADSTVLTFVTLLRDDAADTLGYLGAGDALDVVDGTLTQTSVTRYPATTYVANTWGTVTQNTATWTMSS